jgi:hypothetical protein
MEATYEKTPWSVYNLLSKKRSLELSRSRVQGTAGTTERVNLERPLNYLEHGYHKSI